jgi:dolichol-phosphate mannosyltransferase
MPQISKPYLSVVIPTLNEADNITELTVRIDAALAKHGIEYELIFIDDHSTDLTVKNIERLSTAYPIRLESKIGEKGKAFSLIQGFKLAKYPYVAMIDADLQYPPEALPDMIQMIMSDQADIVVANRQDSETGKLRRLTSNGFKRVFGAWLHGLKCDVQSGLKVFRRSIIDEVEVRPGPWTFDLELLISG